MTPLPFDPTGYLPHGASLLWRPDLIWTQAVADGTIGAAYVAIPLALAAFARRRGDVGIGQIPLLFAAFILLCGIGHLINVVTLWVPVYRLQAVVKVATALVSGVTALWLWRRLPAVLSLPSLPQLRSAYLALRDSEGRLRTTFARAPAPLMVLDMQQVVTAVSDRWLEMMGYGSDEVIGHPVHKFDAPGQETLLAQAWGRIEAGEELRDAPRRYRRRDGTEIEAETSAHLEFDTTGEPLVVFAINDITARRRAEAGLRVSAERLIQTQRLEGLGQLTGGVAHDFNNVLQAVVGNLELIRGRTEGGPGEFEQIDRQALAALEACHRAGRLTTQLLSFARRQRLEPQSVNAAEVIDGMGVLLMPALGRRIALTVEVEPDTGFCLADRSQLEAALLNIVMNARDALGGVGSLRIRLGRAFVTAASDAAERGQIPGEYVRISLTDNGPGMSDEIRSRAFEPFFTTKGPGQGTGLGLAQVHGFAHQSGGTVSLDSQPGRGTTVTLLLPAAEPPTRHTPFESPLEAMVRTPGRRVLLVDDDDMVRRTIAEMLRCQKFEIVEATHADEALAKLDDQPFDAIVSDLSMPGSLDGLGLAGAVRSRGLALPFVLATGHLEPLRGRVLPRNVVVLQKPCGSRRLAETVERLMGGGAVAAM